MKIRHLLVAASAAAILAGTSVGAFAGSHTFSKGESHSSVVSVGTVIWNVPVAVTLQKQSNKSIAVNGGGAGASAGTFGGADASAGGFWSGPSASAFGATHGSSCAGSAC